MSHSVKDLKKLRNKETKKIKKLRSEEIRLGLHDESNSGAEDVDLSEDLHPLSHYVNKREEMVDQMFTIISGNSLTKMLPPLLKDMNLDELKAECLIHLLGMSSKRIISTLEGREIDSSSDSETDSESSPAHSSKTSKKDMTSSKFILKQDGCSDISNDSNEFDKKEDSPGREFELHHKETEVISVVDDTEDGKTTKTKKRKSQSQHSGKKKKHTKPVNLTSKDTNESEADAVSVSDDDDDDDEKTGAVEGNQGKTLLEILELEMRAKAIRALLKQGGEEHKDKNEEGRSSPSISSNNSVPDKIAKDNKKQADKIRNDKEEEMVTIQEEALVTIDLTVEGESSKKDDQNKTFETEHSECISTDKVKDNENTMNVTCENDGENVVKESGELGISSSINTEEATDLIQKEIPKSSWAERWLQSKDVNKVVSTSKMCANIRKRMRNARLAKQLSNAAQNSSTVESDLKTVEGSVTEYQLLNKSENLNTPEEDITLNETKGLSLGSENEINQESVTEVEIANSKGFVDTDISDNAVTDCKVIAETSEHQASISSD